MKQSIRKLAIKLAAVALTVPVLAGTLGILGRSAEDPEYYVVSYGKSITILTGNGLSALRLNLSEYHMHGGGAVCGIFRQDEPSGLDLLVGDVSANVISYVYHSGEIFFDV